jgi:NarL family two-component system response regulator LiaR
MVEPTHHVDTIRILIVDDHAIVRKGQRALIETEPGMKVVGEAGDGIQAVKLAHSLEPDVILLDLLMPRKGGIEAIADIKANNPQIHILVLTSFAEDDKVYAAIKAGAQGYLMKDASPQDILAAINQVYRGEPSMTPAIAHKLMRELQRASDLPPTEEPLTVREVEILKLVAQGLTDRQIANSLVISDRTVSTHVSNILSKLHLANRTQVALYALKEGLADLKS